jgi:hypothetical protein
MMEDLKMEKKLIKKHYMTKTRKYYKVYITNNPECYGANENLQEVARFTSKGLMFACLESIRSLYERSDFYVVYDYTV